MILHSNRQGFRNKLNRNLSQMCLVAAVSFIMAGQFALADDGASKTSVSPYGLRVVAKPVGGDNDMMRAFNSFEGTSIAMLVQQPAGGLISFDSDASKIESFTDDKGKDLLKSSSDFGMPALPMSPDISDGGKEVIIEVNGGQTPTKGATSLKVKGKLVFKAATQKKSYTHKNLEIKADATIEAGPIPLTIGSAGKPEWGEEPLEIVLKAKKRLDEVASIKFLDADGKEIESNESGSMTMAFGEDVSVERSYALGKKVDKVTVEISYWTDMKALEIPVDLTVSLGL
ncbi:MAG: hypothetical protein DHS20C16_01100 [Phycisphaerae bacterium]|nr:MAG: hypothetical protein DHS20C16_01100 [Phycisphaerae bacterium]